jgi:hypothetical protein
MQPRLLTMTKKTENIWLKSSNQEKCAHSSSHSSMEFLNRMLQLNPCLAVFNNSFSDPVSFPSIEYAMTMSNAGNPHETATHTCVGLIMRKCTFFNFITSCNSKHIKFNKIIMRKYGLLRLTAHATLSPVLREGRTERGTEQRSLMSSNGQREKEHTGNSF